MGKFTEGIEFANRIECLKELTDSIKVIMSRNTQKNYAKGLIDDIKEGLLTAKHNYKEAITIAKRNNFKDYSLLNLEYINFIKTFRMALKQEKEF